MLLSGQALRRNTARNLTRIADALDRLAGEGGDGWHGGLSTRSDVGGEG